MMITKTSRRLAVLGACLGLLAGACAQKGPPGGGSRGGPGGMASVDAGPVVKPVALLFAAMDADGDMRVTLKEAENGVDKAWKRMGFPDGLRALDFSDWSIIALGAADAHPSYVAFDNDFDGRISADEFSRRLLREFALMDADNDAVLSRQEMIAKIIQRREQSGQGGPGGRPEGGRGSGGGRQPPGGR